MPTSNSLWTNTRKPDTNKPPRHQTKKTPTKVRVSIDTDTVSVNAHKAFFLFNISRAKLPSHRLYNYNIFIIKTQIKQPLERKNYAIY